MRKFWLFVAAAASGVALAETPDEGLVEQETFKSWRLTVGPVMSPRVRARVRGPRHVSASITVPSSRRSGTGSNTPADPSAGYTERKYSNGYVRPDEGTDDPDSFIAGLTWDWGANDVGGQYSNGRMEFSSEMSRWTESVDSTSYRSGSVSESDRDILLGVEAMGGWTFLNDDVFDASVDGGFRFYGSGDLKQKSRYGTTVTTTRSAYRYVDSYDASGWTDVPSGSHEGTAGGPGRILGATPERREELMDSSTVTETRYYRTDTKLNYRIWDLRLGPSVGWKATDWLTIRGGVYGLLGLVDATLRSSSDLPGGSNRSKKSKCDAVFGMAFGLSAQIDVTDDVFLFGGAEYDWWSDDVTLRTGGSDARIKLSDYTVTVGMGLQF